MCMWLLSVAHKSDFLLQLVGLQAYLSLILPAPRLLLRVIPISSSPVDVPHQKNSLLTDVLSLRACCLCGHADAVFLSVTWASCWKTSNDLYYPLQAVFAPGKKKHDDIILIKLDIHTEVLLLAFTSYK